MTPELASRAGVPENIGGLIVQDVDPGGRGAAAGIRPRDVIVEAGRKPVENAEQLRAAVQSTSDRPLLLLVNRQGRDLFLTVRPS